MKILLAVAGAALMGCDPNSKPTYGEETGLPKNCRAIVQANIDGYRSKEYTAEEVMDSLERNCGAAGHSWGQ
ncbi:kynureninase [Lysobacter sp. N42]|nr:kynureninase [Lysobacter sp. N42]